MGIPSGRPSRLDTAGQRKLIQRRIRDTIAQTHMHEVSSRVQATHPSKHPKHSDESIVVLERTQC
eukprot:9121470-Alexandrium_andersonii.AAC.1